MIGRPVLLQRERQVGNFAARARACSSHVMASDYDAISRENRAKYGTEVSNYGSDFAERYSNRTLMTLE